MKNKKYLFILSISIITLMIISSFGVVDSLQVTCIQKNKDVFSSTLSNNIIFVEAKERIFIKIIDKGDFEFTKFATITEPEVLFLDYKNETKILDDGNELIIISFIAFAPFRLWIYYDGSQVLNVLIMKNSDGFKISNQPMAKFSYTNNNLKYSFDAAASSDPDGGDVNYYLWDFGDGTLSLTDQPTITHTFKEDKEHTVSLTVVDDEGAGNTLTKKIKKCRSDFFKDFIKNFFSLIKNLELINKIQQLHT